MTIVDSQVHAYEVNTPKPPWHSVPNWPDHVTGDAMVAAMDKVGVDGAIFISAFSSAMPWKCMVSNFDSKPARHQTGAVNLLLHGPDSFGKITKRI